jgi:hypothetical protein
MPEVAYNPDPRPQPPYTVPSRAYGPPKASGGTFTGLININHSGAVSTAWLRRAADTQGVSLELSKIGRLGNADGAVALNTGIFQLRGFGWNGSAYASVGRMQLNVNPSADLSVGNSGSYVRFQVCAPSTTAEAESFRSFFSASAEPMLSLGGVSSSVGALKGVNLGVPFIQARAGDDSTWAGIQGAFIQAQALDASNNTQPAVLEAYHEVSGGVGQGATNCGVAVDWRADDATADRQLAMRIATFWEDATHATLRSQARFTLQNAGATLEVLRLTSAGISLFQTQVVGARNTGWTTFTGTANKNAGALDTGTVTTAQLAQVVKAMFDALVTHGLIGT